MDQEQQQKALLYYQSQLEKCRRYNEQHKEEIRQKMKANYQKRKEDPEKYQSYLAKKREYYIAKKKTKELSESI